jgi:hypothetical protein
MCARILVSLLVALILACGGCYQRPMAPELPYSRADVENLRKAIDQMEWE